MPPKKDYGPSTRQSARHSLPKESSSRTTGEASPRTEDSDGNVLATPASPEPEEPAQVPSNPEPEEPVATDRDTVRDPIVASIEVDESDHYSSASEQPEASRSPTSRIPISEMLHATQIRNEMANDDQTLTGQAAITQDQLRELLSELRAQRTEIAGLKTQNNPQNREVTPANSAFGGENFIPTGFAANPAFEPFGDDQQAKNPNYDSKVKESRRDPGVFTGDKDLFDKWIIKLADKCDEDLETFKKERSRMALVFSLTGGLANDLLESRYRSTIMPYKSTAEMIATLAAVYHDANQDSTARAELAKLKYDPNNLTTDIHQFIGKVNSLADKAGVTKELRKTTLYEHIPANLDYRLLKDSKDPRISYEDFAASVADAALAHHRYREERREQQQKNHSREKQSPDRKARRRRSGESQKEVKVTKTPVSQAPRPSEKEMEILKVADLCFICKKPGHQARNCPDRKVMANLLASFDYEGSLQPDETAVVDTSSESSGSPQPEN